MRYVLTGLGKSGTVWLSKFLNVAHEPRGIGDSQLFYDLCNLRCIDHEQKIKTIVNNTHDNHIEVNSFMRLSIDELKKNNVKVIGIVRNPIDLINSLWNHDVFASGNSREIKLVDNGKPFDTTGMTRLEILCHSWRLTTEDLLDKCNVVFNFDKIVSDDSSEAAKLCEFLLRNFDFYFWQELRKEKVHATLQNKTKGLWKDENNYKLNYLDKVCGSMMKQFDYTIDKKELVYEN